MKKKSFLSRLGAKMALAAVALTSVVFTSCEKEEFNFAPVEQPNASATIIIKATSLKTGDILYTETETVAPGADGTIAAGTKTISARELEGYLPVKDITVTIPAVAKGQSIILQADFFYQAISDAAEYPEISVGETIKKEEEATASEEVTNNEDKAKEMEVSYTYLTGQEIENLAEVNKYIDEMVISRAMTDADIRTVLKELVKSYNTGIKSETATKTILVPAFTTVTLKPVTEMITSICTINATIEGNAYSVPNVKIKKAGTVTVEQKEDSIGHDHDHGNSDNAGGGAGGK